MGRPKDLTGYVYGKLIVVELLAFERYGGRVQSKWRCRCECGNTIDLFYDQLPTTVLKQKKMIHAGRRLYDSCESCRQKTCTECGARFCYSRISSVCDSCSESIGKERMLYYYAEKKLRFQTDDTIREKINTYNRDWYRKMKENPEWYARHLEICRRNKRKKIEC